MTAEEPLPPTPLPSDKHEGQAENRNPKEQASGSVSDFGVRVSGFPKGGVGSSRRLAVVLVVAIGVFAFAIWYFALRARDDVGRLQGEWRLTLADRAKQAPITVRVTGDRWVWLVADKEQNRYTMTLRPDANPKEIDLVQLAPDDSPRLEKRAGGAFTPITLRGIYRIEDGTVKLLVAPNPLSRPTSFDATDGDPVWLLERP